MTKESSQTPSETHGKTSRLAATEGRALCVIPARWASSRFPGKPLHEIGGKPLIQHVWERCRLCQQIGASVVATDHEGIAEVVRGFGGEVVMTSPDHASGTDRVAEAARHFPEFDQVINVQGDEPLIDPELVDELAITLREHPDCEMVTAAIMLKPHDPLLDDPNVVKVVCNLDGDALYFSRSRIPYRRDGEEAGAGSPASLRHKGIYGFQRDFLQHFITWPPSALERCEQLEQLRALENGATIRVILTNDDSPGIDTPEQAALLNRQLGSA
jgi:3-deoxy-manno-octulosonate cytidylyltransferase (CMP-KDO synthetase)